jgi:hypothetical protein
MYVSSWNIYLLVVFLYFLDMHPLLLLYYMHEIYCATQQIHRICRLLEYVLYFYKSSDHVAFTITVPILSPLQLINISTMSLAFVESCLHMLSFHKILCPLSHMPKCSLDAYLLFLVLHQEVCVPLHVPILHEV